MCRRLSLQQRGCRGAGAGHRQAPGHVCAGGPQGQAPGLPAHHTHRRLPLCPALLAPHTNPTGYLPINGSLAAASPACLPRRLPACCLPARSGWCWRRWHVAPPTTSPPSWPSSTPTAARVGDRCTAAAGSACMHPQIRPGTCRPAQPRPAADPSPPCLSLCPHPLHRPCLPPAICRSGAGVRPWPAQVRRRGGCGCTAQGRRCDAAVGRRAARHLLSEAPVSRLACPTRDAAPWHY